MQHSSQDYQNNAPHRGFLCWKRRETSWKQMPQRRIYPNIPDNTLPDNEITTSKYTWLTFLPKNLFEQFSHIANIYFLVLSGLETIDNISTTGGTPVLLFPLTFIVIITAAKDFFEDNQRHKSDNEENSRSVQIYSMNTKKFEQTQSENLRVGHVAKVLRNEPISADMIVLNTSEKKDICYIETKNLDGETALKVKYGLKETAGYSDEIMLSSASDLEFDFDRPNPVIYDFQGVLKKGELSYPIDYQNFVPRGSTLRNTDFIYGLVVYTGHETKVMLNSTGARSKDSSIDRQLSKQVITVFVIQLILCTFAATWYNIWAENGIHNHYYIGYGIKNDSGIGPFFVRAGNWILIFTNLVPISLQVVVEIVRFIQANIIMSDYSLRSQEISCVVQSSNLNEDLGKVQHVFSDKTGTLTRNQMVFKKFFIHDQIFGERYHYVLSREQLSLIENVDFRDEEFFDVLRKKNTLVYHKAHDLLLAQALCHEVVVEEHYKRRIYDAASPDELALVNFARLCRFEFRGIDEHNNIIVKFENKEHNFLQLALLKFTSTRKRSSVVVQNPITGTKELYVKGADLMMFSLASQTDAKTIENMKNAAEKFSNEGLRTLVFGKKLIEESTYSKWITKFNEATVALEDREAKIEAVFRELEQDLQLIGVTAIEDKLQDQVDETIEFMKKANIAFWMLTGDQIGTAKSVAVSCKLMDNTMTEITIDGKEEAEVQEALDRGLQLADIQLSQKAPFYTVVTGDAIHELEKHHNLESKFMRIADLSQTIIAARVSPLQKQLIVALVRRHSPNKITLAIGDGANDVNMINAAHIGIGIQGREGKQAARASDYSFGEFKHLKKLLFFYGRECYRRNTICILYNFFKNVILVLPQFWYGFLNNFSGQNLYEPFITQLYNLFYCSFPVIAFAVFDQQYQIIDFMTKPQLYELGQKDKLFKARNFFGWMISAALQAIPIGLIPYFAEENVGLNSNYSLIASFWYSGNVVQMIAVLLSNFKILLFTNKLYLHSILIILASIVFYYANLSIVNQIVVDQLYYTLTLQSVSAYFYLTIFVVLCMAIIPDYAYSVAKEINESDKAKQKSEKSGLAHQKEEDAPLMQIQVQEEL